MTTKLWEYLVDYYDTRPEAAEAATAVTDFLNKRGSQGWELVSTQANSGVLVCIFKAPRN